MNNLVNHFGDTLAEYLTDRNYFENNVGDEVSQYLSENRILMANVKDSIANYLAQNHYVTNTNTACNDEIDACIVGTTANFRDSIANYLTSNHYVQNTNNSCTDVIDACIVSNSTNFRDYVSNYLSRNNYVVNNNRSSSDVIDNSIVNNFETNLSDYLVANHYVTNNSTCPDTIDLCGIIGLPTVVTHSMECGGNIIGEVARDGGSYVTERGICWSTSQNPTIDDNHEEEGSGLGTFQTTIPSMSANRTYYARAYAINEVGIAYGNVVSYTSPNLADGMPCLGAATVADHQGNIYNTVQIGNQCWTKENMRATTSPKNLMTAGNLNNPSKTTPYYYNPASSAIPLEKRGLLYNWAAALDTTFTTDNEDVSFVNRRGICPAGWHVPSNAEWETMVNYLGSQQCYTCGGNSANVAKVLASREHWRRQSNACAVANQAELNNATGFNGLPMGYYNAAPEALAFVNDSATSPFWTSTSNGTEGVYYKFLSRNRAYVFNGTADTKHYGFGVRCIKNQGGIGIQTGGTVPTVTTTNADLCSGTASGNVTNQGSSPVHERGFVVGTSPSPTIAAIRFQNATAGTGTFTNDNISGLYGNTKYYVRAYAINASGVGYGNDIVSYSQAQNDDGGRCPGAYTVTDHEGNIYNTVKIGAQCWTKENMRSTTSPKGYLRAGKGKAISDRIAYYYDNTSSTIPAEERGMYYNWSGAMDTTTSTNLNMSFTNRRGICPEGWHVPSSQEFDILANYLMKIECNKCGETSGTKKNVARVLASTSYWRSNTESECNVGYDLSANNITGFTAIPSGFANNHSTFANQFERAQFITSDATTAAQTSTYTLGYDSRLLVKNDETYKRYGQSVRCIQDGSGYSSGNATVSMSDYDMCSGTFTATITTYGVTNIQRRGFCYSRHPISTINDRVVYAEPDVVFSASLEGLLSGTSYYVRAFLVEEDGVSYSNEIKLTTPMATDAKPCASSPTVTDHEGNVYNTVQIGNQCWTKENMRCSTSPNGYLDTVGIGSGYYNAYYRNHTPTMPIEDFGLSYNWLGAMDTVFTSSDVPVSFTNRRGICPEGWHVPSSSEWEVLRSYVGSVGCYVCGRYNTRIGSALATDKPYWDTPDTDDGCLVGNNVENNNKTGFSAVPVGTGDNAGQSSPFWTSTLRSANYADYNYLMYRNSNFSNFNGFNRAGFRSVRCLKNDHSGESSVLQSLITERVSCDGNDGVSGGTVIGYLPNQVGVCYATHSEPTFNDNYTIDVLHNNKFTSTLPNIASSVDEVYFVRAYVIIGEDTIYAHDVTFKTLASTDANACAGTPTVTDHEGNVYNTVQIGNQCWMKENMRCKTSPKGILTAGGTAYSSTTPYYYDNTSSSIPLQQRGYFYNAMAMLDTANYSFPEGYEDNVSPYPLANRRGICPEGWRLPQYGDYKNLTNYLETINCENCDVTSTDMVGKSVASKEFWFESPTDDNCAVGYMPELNNGSNFSVYPTGLYYRGSFWYEGEGAYLHYNSLQSDNLRTSRWALRYDAGQFSPNNLINSWEYGYPVRCIKSN